MTDAAGDKRNRMKGGKRTGRRVSQREREGRGGKKGKMNGELAEQIIAIYR